jgi:hypothetical protein
MPLLPTTTPEMLRISKKTPMPKLLLSLPLKGSSVPAAPASLAYYVLLLAFIR